MASIHCSRRLLGVNQINIFKVAVTAMEVKQKTIGRGANYFIPDLVNTDDKYDAQTSINFKTCCFRKSCGDIAGVTSDEAVDSKRDIGLQDRRRSAKFRENVTLALISA